jgi:hypothetical protein
MNNAPIRALVGFKLIRPYFSGCFSGGESSQGRDYLVHHRAPLASKTLKDRSKERANFRFTEKPRWKAGILACADGLLRRLDWGLYGKPPRRFKQSVNRDRSAI